MSEWRFSKDTRYHNSSKRLVHVHGGQEHRVVCGRFHKNTGEFVEERWFCADCDEPLPEDLVFVAELSGVKGYRLNYYSYPFFKNRGKGQIE